ncbi:MAG: hypothetical protein JXX28_10900 [Deltaproteobacteria bacterium]|nr:hypothetical protein [Deltaproteobacteria bacterium]
MIELWVRGVSALWIAGALLAGCGDPNNCKEGDEACLCTDQAMDCLWNCSGGDCSFTADVQTTATFTCDGGGCDLVSTDQAAVRFECEGGGCTVTADDQTTVTLVCAGGGCSASADGESSVNTSECTDCTCTPIDLGECDGVGVDEDR